MFSTLQPPPYIPPPGWAGGCPRIFLLGLEKGPRFHAPLVPLARPSAPLGHGPHAVGADVERVVRPPPVPRLWGSTLGPRLLLEGVKNSRRSSTPPPGFTWWEAERWVPLSPLGLNKGKAAKSGVRDPPPPFFGEGVPDSPPPHASLLPVQACLSGPSGTQTPPGSPSRLGNLFFFASTFVRVEFMGRHRVGLGHGLGLLPPHSLKMVEQWPNNRVPSGVQNNVWEGASPGQPLLQGVLRPGSLVGVSLTALFLGL